MQGGAFIDHATSVPSMDHGLQGYHEGITGRKPDIPEGITGRTPRIPEHEGIILQCHKIHHYSSNKSIHHEQCM